MVVLGLVFGVLASAVQFLGLIRWPFLVPYLAQVSEGAAPGSPRELGRHRLPGVQPLPRRSDRRAPGLRVHGHLVDPRRHALVDSTVVADRLGAIGVALGPLFLLCSLGFVGRAQDSEWKLAETLTPITYVAWSSWLVVVGVGLLI